MTRLTIAALSLVLLSATAASAGTSSFKTDTGTFRTDPGTFGAHPRMPSMAPPKPPAPPAPPAPPGYRSSSYEGGFKPWKPSMRVDSNRGGVNAYPQPKKPKGYIGPF